MLDSGLLDHIHKGMIASVCLVMTFSAITGCSQKQSVFLEDSAQLEAEESDAGVQFYINPDLPLDHYDSFMLDPIVIDLAPDNENLVVDPEEVEQLALQTYNRALLIISKNLHIVKRPGPNVLRIRLALTSVQKVSEDDGVVLGFEGASMEGEALDSQSSKRVFAAIHSMDDAEEDDARRIADVWIAHFVPKLGSDE